MNGIGPGPWLVAAMLLVAGGALVAIRTRESAGTLAGALLVLGGAVVVLVALVRHAVLPVDGIVTAVLATVLGAVLVMIADRRSAS